MKNNIVFKDIKEFNIIILILIGLILIGISGYSSYAIFSDEVVSNNEIKAIVKQPNLDKSGANAPTLIEGLIPVYYDNTSSSWKKADSENKNKNYKWYDYESKMWANAVTVTSTNRTTYLNASAGTKIPIEDINTMWVWIPRYKYTYFASSTPVEIPITFEKGVETTGTIKCTDAIVSESGKSETCTDTTNGTLTVGKSTYTHPAFTFGSEQLPGIWVAKFELSGTVSSSVAYVEKDDGLRQISNTEEYNDLLNKNTDDKGVIKKLAPEPMEPTNVTCTNENCNISNVTILPNKTSLKNESIGSLHYILKSMQNNLNIYGLAGDLDMHIIKNMEWASVAYLSHSKYGTCKDGVCTEIGINNNNQLLTGCGSPAASEGTDTCNAYNTTSGVVASTTGNVYGIYDMSGGIMEYVMANMHNSDNTFYAGYSGAFTDVPLAEKYYDKYSFSYDPSEITRGKLGDASIELSKTDIMSNWYDDYARFPYASFSRYYLAYMVRGGYHSESGGNKIAGIFNYALNSGGGEVESGSRGVMTITN